LKQVALNFFELRKGDVIVRLILNCFLLLTANLKAENHEHDTK